MYVCIYVCMCIYIYIYVLSYTHIVWVKSYHMTSYHITPKTELQKTQLKNQDTYTYTNKQTNKTTHETIDKQTIEGAPKDAAEEPHERLVAADGPRPGGEESRPWIRN